MRIAVAVAFLLVSTFTAAGQDASQSYDFMMAKFAANEGRYDEALSRIGKLIDKSPQDAVLRFERAMMLIDARRPDRAEADLIEVTRLEPDLYDGHRALSRLLLDRAGNDRALIDKAAGHLREAFRINGDDLSAGAMLAQIYMGTEQHAAAEKVLATLTERAPDNRQVNFMYAQVLTKLGRGDESRKYLERALEIDPTFTPAILQLVDIYEKEREWKLAAEVLEPLIEENGTNIDLQRQQAVYLLRAGDTAAARTALERIIAAEPGDVKSQFYLAESLGDLGEHVEADRIYKKLLDRDPGDPEVLSSYGINLTAQEKYDEAAAAFNRILSLPVVAENFTTLAKTQLAWIDFQRGQFDSALTRAREVLVFRNEPNAQAVSIAVDALRSQKKYAQAIELLQPLSDRFPAHALVNGRLVEMLARSGDTPKAMTLGGVQARVGTRNAIAAAEAFVVAGDYRSASSLLESASKAKPDDVDLRFQLGSVYERGGDIPSAEKTFLAILEKQPDYAPALNYLGYMWADRNMNVPRAAEMLERAIAKEPKNGAYLDSLGWAYYKLGKLDLAIRFLGEASAIIANDPTIIDHLADVYGKSGDSAKAVELYRRALTMGPDEELTKQIKSKLAAAEKQIAARK